MAKLERYLIGDFDALLDYIHRGILNGSASASYEDGSDYYGTDSLRCAVRVYERYSMMGGNRVSLNLTLVEDDGRVFVSAITSGGSQAVLFKINTLGESAFLDCVSELLDGWSPEHDLMGNEGAMGERRSCPCCGNYTLHMPTGSYELCPVCCWTDDSWATEHPKEMGDYNEVDLETARRNYRKFSACTEALRGQTRPPEAEELPEVYLRIHETGS